MNKKDKPDFVSMRDALGQFKNQQKLKKGLQQTDVEQAWKTAMGPGIMTYTTGVRFSEGTLYVTLDSSVMRHELSYGKTKIINKLNDHLGEPVIKKLFLK
jgi:hypothetical protein